MTHRLSKSPEEWRCENCNDHEKKLGDNRENDICDDTQMEVPTTSVEEGNLDGETVTTEPAVNAKSEVWKKTINQACELLEGRTVYTEGELECILKENYREERERNKWRDTNVTNTLKSLKGELLGRLSPRERN